VKTFQDHVDEIEQARKLKAAAMRRLDEIAQAQLEAQKVKKPRTPTIPATVEEFQQLPTETVKWLMQYRKTEIDALFAKENMRRARAELKRQLEEDRAAEEFSLDFQERIGGSVDNPQEKRHHVDPSNFGGIAYRRPATLTDTEFLEYVKSLPTGVLRQRLSGPHGKQFEQQVDDAARRVAEAKLKLTT
jgi:hypothetical protein